MKNVKNIVYIVLSGTLFSLSVNLFLIPAGIYNGGIVGISQLLRDLFLFLFKIDVPFDIAGVINFFINVPIFIFAWKRLSPTFVKLSLLNIIVQSIALSLIPIPKTPLVSDLFIAILIAAILGAFGSSLSFRVKGSSGGLDVIGVYRSQKRKGSIGSIYLIVNACIYTVCFLVYNAETALYSLIYSTIFSFALDKFHEHNIEVSVMVFTKNREIKHDITQEIRRGVTYWEGFGAYTNSNMDIFVTIVSQSEVPALKKVIRKKDPNAFIIITQNLKIDGGFEKRLI